MRKPLVYVPNAFLMKHPRMSELATTKVHDRMWHNHGTSGWNRSDGVRRTSRRSLSERSRARLDRCMRVMTKNGSKPRHASESSVTPIEIEGIIFSELGDE